ncbi:hypothetical protein ABZ402_49720 [Streptomyces mirabilis]|uniref:hypothetical protein n=1 Tax=Streptomyces mirabilis TaxID=68239 RepID=UPI0033F78FE8
MQRPAVSVKADDYRGDRSVAYQHNSEEDYRRDGYRARQHSDRFADSHRYDHDSNRSDRNRGCDSQ